MKDPLMQLSVQLLNWLEFQLKGDMIVDFFLIWNKKKSTNWNSIQVNSEPGKIIVTVASLYFNKPL